MHALEITKFTKRYGATIAVHDVSLTVKEGEFFGFLGPNGAGKTTTINCITGIATVTEGTITVFGADVMKDYHAARKHVGLSPQEFNVDIFSTPRKILWFVGGYYGIPKKEREKRIDTLFQILDLAKVADQKFRTLSGGFKRRVMLARALIHNPPLLILDEPTAGVDVELRHELWRYLRRINEEGKTILFTSHYLEEVEKLCNRIAIIHKGKIEMIGDKHEFVAEGKSLEDTYLELIQRDQPKAV
ncbi:MAG TPA: ABC transporter ATP-binding protein [Candidatus Kapabacteria bacterium]|nr:ABC transporter ATP-binding protein [Candidatus Kapabacteria bacterium]